DAGLVLVLAHDGLVIVDPATGKERRRIAVAGDHEVAYDHTIVVATATAVRAIDLDTSVSMWSTPLVATHLEHDASALLAVDRNDVLPALDLATGTELATWGSAGQTIAYWREDPRFPLLVMCGAGKLTALDPSGAVRPPETVTIDGTVACTGCE